MNPARSIGPALLPQNLDTLWIYLSAPVVGTFLAWSTCRWTPGDECRPTGRAAES
jgi:glycerol uptake facilitator-like aquaporin